MADGLFNPSRLYETLAQYGLLPEVSTREPVSGASGEFNPYTNRAMTGGNRQTTAHELTHATQWNLLMSTAERIAEKMLTGSKEKPTDKELQFLDAYKKLFNTHIGTVSQFNPIESQQRQKATKQMLDFLYYKSVPESKKDKEWDTYRTSPRELQSFGVGSMSDPYALKSPYQHLDPTMTTEFDILLTMFDKLPETVKQQATKTKKEKLDTYRKENPDEFVNPYVRFDPLFSDPFKSTIK